MDGELAERLAVLGNLVDGITGSISHLKCGFQRSGLFRRRLQFQLDGKLHLAAFLLLDIVLDRFGRNIPGAGNIVGTAPQRRQARVQMHELITQDARGVAFELIGKLLWSKRRRAIHLGPTLKRRPAYQVG